MLALLGGLYVGGAVSLMLGFPVSASSAVAGLAAGWLFPQLTRTRGEKRSFVIAPVALAVCVLASMVFYDGSSDALIYHKPAMLQLLDGWNPYRAAAAGSEWGYWTVVYPKASWICGAQLVAITGQLESAKAINLLALLAAAATGWTFLNTCWRLHGPLAALGAMIIALNPVAVAQATSFYVDGLLTSLFTILLLHLALLVSGATAHGGWIPIALTTVLLVNVKFTGLVYAGLALAIAGVFLIGSKGARPAVRFGVVTTLILWTAVGLLGKTPYVDNFRIYGHPLHPVMGPNRIPTLLDGPRPTLLASENRIVRFAVAQFAVETGEGQLGRRWPLQFHPFTPYPPDRRVGLLGPWFGEVLAAAAFVWLLAAWRAKAPLAGATGAFLAAVVSITGFCHEDAWLARYSPQLYLLGVLPALFFVTQAGALRTAGAALILFLALGAGLVTFNALGRTAWISYRLSQDVAEMRHAGQHRPIDINLPAGHPLARTLRERGVSFTAHPGADTRHWRPVYGTTTVFWRSAADS